VQADRLLFDIPIAIDRSQREVSARNDIRRCLRKQIIP
jgi:hypothetical protein